MSISPPFHRPSRNDSVLPSRSPGRCSRDSRISGSGCLFSAFTNATVATAAVAMAAMISGEVQPRTTPWDTANTMRAMALVISRAPRTSRRWAWLAVFVFVAVPRMAGARAAAARPTGTLTRNTARQLVNSTSTPPRTWPETKPTEEIAPYRPMARVRSAPSGKLVVMRDSAAGATIAAPAPWMTRAVISSTGSWARPPAKQVGGPAAQDEQAAERDGVPGDDPLHGVRGHVQLPLDRGQRDVHDAEVEDDHERRDEDEG